MIYTSLFTVTFLSLALWFLFKEQNETRNLFGKIFLAAFTLFVGSSFLIPGYASWVSLGMHLSFLFGGGLFLNTFSRNKIVFSALMLLMSGGYVYIMTGVNLWPFETKAVSETTPSSTKLDADNELLIELKNGEAIASLQQLINQYNLEVAPAFKPLDGNSTDLDDYYTVNIPEGKINELQALIQDLQKSGLVDHVEENELLSLDPMELQSSPTPPNKGKYSVNDPQLTKVWGFEAMKVQSLYDLLKSTSVRPKKVAKIAIIDTGVDGQHEDLKANFVSTRKEYNEDPHGHGTHCAGIAAAVSNNKVGIASFALDNRFVKVTSIQVFGKYGSTSQKKIIDGMIEAVDSGADVLSMSLGGPSTDQTQRAYKQAVAYANNHGAIVIVAAGNENIDARKRAPASVEGVITVAAIDEALDKAKFSNDVSKIKMGIAAPGVQIYSTIPGNKYEYFNGTSMATPYVAGLVGVMKSINPTLNTAQVYRILQQTSQETRNTSVTGGLINPAQAVKAILK